MSESHEDPLGGCRGMWNACLIVIAFGIVAAIIAFVIWRVFL